MKNYNVDTVDISIMHHTSLVLNILLCISFNKSEQYTYNRYTPSWVSNVSIVKECSHFVYSHS